MSTAANYIRELLLDPIQKPTIAHSPRTPSRSILGQTERRERAKSATWL